MKKYLGSLAAVVALFVLSAIPLAYARGGGGGGGGMGGHGGGGFSGGGWHGGGGFGGGGWHGGEREFHGGGWGWHHGHGFYGGYFWGGPFWWGYPYWWWPPYDYYDYDYYGYPPAYDGNYGYPYAYQYDYPSRAYPEYDGRDYLMLGHDSGKALRSKSVSHDWLVDYLRAYVVNAPLSVRDDFRRGFIAGYGEGGQKVLKEALKEARQPVPPPSLREAEPESNGASKQP